MSEGRLDAALAESVRDVLEKMFFLDLAEPPGDAGRPAGVMAEVTFEGDPPGTFQLDLDLTAARAAAADFLGEDPDELSVERTNEVVCELANMICGSVLSRVESRAAFRLATPRIALAGEKLETRAEASFRAAVGEGLLRAEIRMERAACTGIEKPAS